MNQGGTVRLTAENRVLEGGGPARLSAGRYVEFTVADQGAGIPPEILPHIFDPYFTTKPDGSGVGLASAFSIVRRHGGELRVDSNPGTGSRFSILLPAADGGEVQPESTPEHRREEPRRQGARVLVMDDEEMLRELAVEMLGDLGYRPLACTDGQAAVDLYRQAREAQEPFGAVILDLTVRGGMGGREAAERIHALDPRAVLILSTGYSADVADLARQDQMFSGVLMKPYDVGRLDRELRRLLKPDQAGVEA